MPDENVRKFQRAARSSQYQRDGHHPGRRRCLISPASRVTFADGLSSQIDKRPRRSNRHLRELERRRQRPPLGAAVASTQCWPNGLASNSSAAGLLHVGRPSPPVATLATAWGPPAMTPRFRAPAKIESKSRASSPPPPIAVSRPIAVSGRSPLRFALRCGQRQADAERHCPTRRISDYLSAINHSLRPLCNGERLPRATALTDEYCWHRSYTQV